MPTNYDKIATIYDAISRMVFGKALVNAQVSVLKYIPANSRVLIVGGGTGWILEEIAILYPQGLMIDYVESSPKMIALSEKRNYGTNHVRFINIRAEELVTAERYDVILTPFFFDNFKAAKIQFIFSKLNALLKPQGIWLYIDFVDNGRLWQKILLKMMYLFFGITSGIETQELMNMDSIFNKDFDTIHALSHYHHFVRSIVYQKRSV